MRANFVNELRYLVVADREQAASRIVLENCVDPVLSPKVYGAFAEEQKRTIRDYYMQTALLGHALGAPDYESEVRVEVATRTLKATGGIEPKDPRINLFRAVV